jgi:hypothetical protein
MPRARRKLDDDHLVSESRMAESLIAEAVRGPKVGATVAILRRWFTEPRQMARQHLLDRHQRV